MCAQEALRSPRARRRARRSAPPAPSARRASASTPTPSSKKCFGASTCVPVCEPKESSDTLARAGDRLLRSIVAGVEIRDHRARMCRAHDFHRSDRQRHRREQMVGLSGARRAIGRQLAAGWLDPLQGIRKRPNSHWPRRGSDRTCIDDAPLPPPGRHRCPADPRAGRCRRPRLPGMGRGALAARTAERTLGDYAKIADWQLTQQAKNALLTRSSRRSSRRRRGSSPIARRRPSCRPPKSRTIARAMVSWCNCLVGRPVLLPIRLARRDAPHHRDRLSPTPISHGRATRWSRT